MTYVDGFLVPVPKEKKDAYIALAEKAAPIWMEYGALHYMECWGDDIAPGKTNDFRTAVIAEEGEEVVFSWVVWPSKEVRDAGNAKIMSDERLKMEGEEMPFSGARMIYGGFSPVVERKA
ncbi:DUF1428 domain-containing protein [Sphingobium ummariense]|uniref:RNA signal recognition particle 4.5S RNA n=1 Tax=Sphingobium ummariense RL-3 TaxID=1346791 RepID=T0IZJ0_9SPHN|nr:DUF1428 domain-containing protein [Sphingobium ummariense]EQB34195.1 hypothetical protein M529_00855 [Sphingobium ummariense RL-3]